MITTAYSHGMVYVFERRTDPGKATCRWTQVGCASGDSWRTRASSAASSQANSALPMNSASTWTSTATSSSWVSIHVDQSYVPGVGSVDVFERTAAGAAWASLRRDDLLVLVADGVGGDYTNFGGGGNVGGHIVVRARKQDARNDDGGTVSTSARCTSIARRDSTWSRTASLFAPGSARELHEFLERGPDAPPSSSPPPREPPAPRPCTRASSRGARSRTGAPAKLEDREYGGWMGDGAPAASVRRASSRAAWT